MVTWHKSTLHTGRAEQYYADRPDGIEMNVTANADGTHTVYVYDPSTNTEYLDGEIPDTTVNACIARAESVRLPEEDTGI